MMKRPCGLLRGLRRLVLRTPACREYMASHRMSVMLPAVARCAYGRACPVTAANNTSERGYCMESLEMEAVLQRRRPPTLRWLTVLLAAALVLLSVGGLILVTVPNTPASLGELLHGTPTPTPTIAPGGNLVFYVHSAPWGQLTVDGKLALIPASLSESFLDRGRHTLQYH